MGKISDGVTYMPDDYQAEDDLRTLIRAQEIKADKARYNKALKKRDDMKKQLGGIHGKV